MNASSYLEAFLTVYGWDIYYVLYLLFGALGLFLYPIARIINDVFVNYLSGSEYAGTNFLRQALTMIVLVVLVFLIALMPVVEISFNKTVVKSVCQEKKDAARISQAAKTPEGDAYFANLDTRVPIMPWIAMAVGQGINSVIYNEVPCVLDVTDSQQAMMNINLEKAENPELLKAELNRFINECHRPAVKLANQLLTDDEFTNEAAAEVKTKMNNAISSEEKSEKVILGNYDSKFIRDLFYDPNSPLINLPETQTIPPLKAKNPVPGYNGYEEDGSIKQGASGAAPSCHDWWTNGSGGTTEPLRLRVLKALSDSMVVNVASPLGVSECLTKYSSSTSGGWGHGFRREVANPEACRARIIREIYQGNQDKYSDELFKNLQGGGANDDIASGSSNLVVGVGILAGLGASVLGLDFGQGEIINAIGGFYIQLYILKLLLHYLIPMVLMAIYIFWALYMIIGELRGMTMIKGMILITALTMMPSLWALIEHLDDGLYEALYGGWEFSNPLDRVMLDAATSIFEIAIVFVLFFLINEAGGGDARRAVNDSQSMGSSASSGVGSSTGRSVTKTGLRTSRGIRRGIMRGFGKTKK